MIATMAHPPFAKAAPSAPARVEDRTTETMAKRARGGDRGALGALLRDHARSVHELCFHVAGAADAHDAAQESLERIVTSIALFDPGRGTFRSWALAVARNVCRDRLRRRGLERAAFDADGDERAILASSEWPDPERMTLARADARALERALADLPEPMRAALVLFHVHEASYEEIATALEVPIGTVMTWLHRGRKRLRESLSEEA